VQKVRLVPRGLRALCERAETPPPLARFAQT
jgi:hypothetical protein